VVDSKALFHSVFGPVCSIRDAGGGASVAAVGGFLSGCWSWSLYAIDGSQDSVGDGAAKSVVGIRSRVTVVMGVGPDRGIRLCHTGRAPSCSTGMFGGGVMCGAVAFAQPANL
jgi:hypothetical protein